MDLIKYKAVLKVCPKCEMDINFNAVSFISDKKAIERLISKYKESHNCYFNDYKKSKITMRLSSKNKSSYTFEYLMFKNHQSSSSPSS